MDEKLQLPLLLRMTARITTVHEAESSLLTSLTEGRQTGVLPFHQYKRALRVGLQVQNANGHTGDVKTIEGVILESIFRAGGISSQNRGDTQKIGWMRCGTNKFHRLISFTSSHCFACCFVFWLK